jgi:hypothetical protein
MVIRADAPAKCHCATMDGGAGALNYHVYRHLDAEVQGSEMDGPRLKGAQSGSTLMSYLAGPRASMTLDRFIPFAHVLFGSAHATASDGLGTGTSAKGTIATMGGGVDLVVSRDTSVRLLDVDHSIVHLDKGFNSSARHYSMTFGIVFRFGERRKRHAL